MTYEEARHYLWRKPFQPVRIRLKDGRTFDILHRGMTLAAESILIIGLPPADDPNAEYSDRTIWVRWPEVEAIQPLSQPAAPTTGRPCALDSESGNPDNPLIQVLGGKIAMTCEEARKSLWREPFQPVRIRLKDGRTFDIPDLGWTIAAEALLMVGVPPQEDPSSRFPDHLEWVRWPEVDTIEPLSEPAAPAV
jgi:hypothetical protein